jgi:hypothetical protein
MNFNAGKFYKKLWNIQFILKFARISEALRKDVYAFLHAMPIFTRCLFAKHKNIWNETLLGVVKRILYLMLRFTLFALIKENTGCF